MFYSVMPIGSVSNFVYQQQELNLSAGDCIVVMTDSFPEMFNTENEMLGFTEARSVLEEVAHQQPQEIIDRFVKVGEQWANGKPQNGDVTFVVLKINANHKGDS